MLGFFSECVYVFFSIEKLAGNCGHKMEYILLGVFILKMMYDFFCFSFSVQGELLTGYKIYNSFYIFNWIFSIYDKTMGLMVLV